MGRESSIDETILRKILADGNIQIDGRVDGFLRNCSEELRTILCERNLRRVPDWTSVSAFSGFQINDYTEVFHFDTRCDFHGFYRWLIVNFIEEF